jgi:pantothenate kinase
VSRAELLDSAAALTTGGRRALLGITGAPGAGKSTLAEWLVRELTARGLPAVGVPMDGFHLADVALDALGRRARKGAPDTFDADGYLALLQRLRTGTTTVYAPAFERELEQPIAGRVAVPPETRVVVTEGNYLLVDEAPWSSVRGELDEVWFVDVDDEVRRTRLIDRHVLFGKSPEEAAQWVSVVDEPNAHLVALGRQNADRRVEIDRLGLGPHTAR